MLYRRKRRRGGVRSGFYRFETDKRKHVFGYGDGDTVHLRDEHGDTWIGQAEEMGDETTRFIFKSGDGRRVSGIADENGVVLRDDAGHTWRGYID